MMGGTFSKPKVDPLPLPDPPVVPGQPGTPRSPRSKAPGSSRSRTIMAGDVTPNSMFKRRTLG